MTEITSAATANAVANPPRSNPLRILYIQSTVSIKKPTDNPGRSSIHPPRMHQTTSGPSGNLAEQPVGRGLLEFGPGVWMGKLTPRRVQTHRPRVSDLLVSIVYCGLFVGRSQRG